MDSGKPLIFIKPYSKTLEKLVEVLKESSEDQGTEIYEIEDVKEAIQIIPQLGQSLIIAAHPRKSAQILQSAGKLIRKLQSKVLLLTPKPIPRRTIDKFMKVGLTECIIEPIAPKTLQYKVNLLLRSIVIKKEEGDYDQKFDSDHDQSNDEELARKKLSANIKAEDNDESEGIDDGDSPVSEEKVEKKKSTYKEESIAGYYKGSSKKKQESSDDDNDANKTNSEVIEGYYKNKIQKNDTENDVEPGKKTKEKHVDEDEYEELKKSASLLLEDAPEENEEQHTTREDNKDIKQKKASLVLEEDKIKKEIEKEVQSEQEDLEDVASHHLDLIDDLDENEEKPENATPKNDTSKKTKKLEFEDELLDESVVERLEDNDKFEESKKSSSLTLEDDPLFKDEEKNQQDDKAGKNSKVAKALELEEDQDLNDELEEMADQLDTIDRKSPTALKVEEEVLEKEEQEKLEVNKKSNKKAAPNLDIVEEKSDKADEVDTSESNDLYSKKKVKELEVKEDNFDYGRKKRVEKQKHQVEREIQEREENKRKAERENQGYTEREINNKSSGYTENIQEQVGNKADAHADKLKTHYDSRQGLKHDDEEWREVERERRSAEEFKVQKKNEFAMPEKTDWGEQTIDYSDLKKQFEETGYTLSGKKEVGQFEDSESTKTGIRYAQAIGVNADIDEEMLEEILEEKKEEEQNKIFEAELKSSLTLIKSLNMYYQYSKSRDDAIKAILELIRDDFGALAAIKYGKGPLDGKLKIETFGKWLDDTSRDSIISIYADAASCPILPSYSDKTFEQKRTTFFYPFTEGITTFAWVQCFLPNGIKESELKGLEASLETMRGALLDEFYELGGTGPYAEMKKKTIDKNKSSSPASKIGSFFGGLFGKKKAS